MTAEAELFDAPRVEQREKALAELEAINAEIDEILHFYRVPDWIAVPLRRWQHRLVSPLLEMERAAGKPLPTERGR